MHENNWGILKKNKDNSNNAIQSLFYTNDHFPITKHKYDFIW